MSSDLSFTDYGEAETGEQVAARTLAAIAAALAAQGWTPGGEGVVEVALAEAVSGEAADLRYIVLRREPARYFREFGVSVANVPVLAGTPATMPVRLDLVEAGQSAPGGLLLVGTTADGVDVEFSTGDAVTAAAGATSVTVTATAIDEGDVGNGVPIGPLVLATATATVLAATATSASVGGTDPETPEEYQDRLVQVQSTSVRSIVLGPDAAIQARTVPGVHRAIGVDNYDAQTATAGVERTVSVYAVDSSGNDVVDPVRSNLRAYLQSLREVNFIVRVGSPTYTPVAIVFAAKARAGADPAGVRAAMIARAYAILDPGAWAGGDEEPPTWRDNRTVRYLDIAAQLDAVEGCDYLTSLTLNGAGVDVTLPGIAALPASRTAATPTTVAGTVTS